MRTVPKVLTALTLAAGITGTLLHCNRAEPDAGPGAADSGTEERAGYRGRESCRECHEKEYNLFLGSDHDMAMDTATAETVLGNFNDVTFTHLGVTSRFYTSDGKYYVYTEGPNGEMDDFEISYVFAIRPLQQYLVAFPGGRYQC
ncbi:MAG TPA: hypothetical protein ENO05_11385, partial [Bacteroides sp.]|nr:hypothetical protein [Bacteroides sp.]